MSLCLGFCCVCVKGIVHSLLVGGLRDVLHITGLDSPIGLKCKNATNRICCAGPKNRFCCSFTVIREHCQYYSLPLHPTNEPRPYGRFILCIWTGNRKYSETSLFIYCLSKLNQTRLSTFSLYFFYFKMWYLNLNYDIKWDKMTWVSNAHALFVCKLLPYHIYS